MIKMNIKVGEYIRTKQGDISKVECVEKENIILEDSVWSKNDLYEKTDVLYFDDEEIVKHSKNIIDLIEVGDYVNGKYVYKNGTDFGGEKCLHMENSEVYACEDFLYEKDIKSIVTKEQFSNMEYRL